MGVLPLVTYSMAVNASGDIFELSLNKEDFKFSAAHFVAHNGGRERLHGHNYRVRVVIRGRIGTDGYVVDFADAKLSIRSVCKELDERFLLPTRSTSTSYVVHQTGCERASGAKPCACSKDGQRQDDGAHGPGHASTEARQVDMTVLRDGSRFSFPLADVILLPLENSTVEELSRYIARRIWERLEPSMEVTAARRLTALTVGVAETQGQEALYTLNLGMDSEVVIP